MSVLMDVNSGLNSTARVDRRGAGRRDSGKDLGSVILLLDRRGRVVLGRLRRMNKGRLLYCIVYSMVLVMQDVSQGSTSIKMFLFDLGDLPILPGYISLWLI
jgi:hypothetical protein